MAGTPPLVLLDQGVPREAVSNLRASGIECVHVGEIGMQAAADTEILDWALQNYAIVVTLDADFHAILAVSGASKPSVIRIRQQGLNRIAVARLVIAVIEAYSRELAAGSMITVKARKITCRLLRNPG